jgi:hypothetical protein
MFEIETGLLAKQLGEQAKKSSKLIGFSQKGAQLTKRRRQRQRRKRFVVHSLKRQNKIRALGSNRRAKTVYNANRKRKRTLRIFKRKRK